MAEKAQTCRDQDHVCFKGLLLALLCLQVQLDFVSCDLGAVHLGVQLELETLLGQGPLEGFPHFCVLQSLIH